MRDRALRLLMRVLKNGFDLVFGKLVEHQHSAARQERAVDFKRRILGGRADECDGAVFDCVQQCILLRLVEAMDLVDEEYGAFAVTFFGLRLLNGFAQIFHAGEDGGQGDEVESAAVGEQAREGCFACAGCAPENQRGQRAAAREQSSQDAAFADEMRLADKLRQANAAACARPAACLRGASGASWASSLNRLREFQRSMAQKGCIIIAEKN